MVFTEKLIHGLAKDVMGQDKITFGENEIDFSSAFRKLPMAEAVVEYTEAPGNEVLLHVSELAWERTNNVTDVVNMGDILDVKYFGLDPRTRKEKVSRKAILPKPEGFVERPPRDNSRGRDQRGSRDNRGRDNRRDDRRPRDDRKPKEENKKED